jgi:hypothetical protein
MAESDTDKEIALRRLQGLVGRIPKSSGGWSYDRSKDFKRAHAKAMSSVFRKQHSLEDLKNSFAVLASFFEPEETP